MKQHGIGWLNVPGYRPETWNPIVGCSKVSEGCRNCYAERMASRLCAMNVDQYKYVMGPANGDNSAGVWLGKTRIVKSALSKPLGWKKPRAIFVNSMGDLFHEATPDEWIGDVLEVIKRCPQHLFIILTKRALRMEQFMQSYFRLPAKNVWLGVTVENQDNVDRVDHLLRTPAAVRFVSCEPMLGPVDLARYLACGGCGTRLGRIGAPCCPDGEAFLDWIICGGESGRGARPMDPEWARSLRDQAQAAGVPYFFKQWGDNIPALAYDSVPLHNASMQGKRGGDFLDGRQWHQWPSVAGCPGERQ
jgi:protein gp37